MLAVLAATSVIGTITNCDSNSVFKPSRLGLFPDPPVKGKTVDMIVEFENPGPEVTDGKATTSLSLNYIPVPTDVKPLCEVTGCPLTPGFNNRSTSSVWPDSVGGKVNSKIVWTNRDGKTLLCIQMSTTIAVDNSAALVEYKGPFYNHSHNVPTMHSGVSTINNKKSIDAISGLESDTTSSEKSPTYSHRNLRA
jgi:hypothetical protein